MAVSRSSTSPIREPHHAGTDQHRITSSQLGAARTIVKLSVAAACSSRSAPKPNPTAGLATLQGRRLGHAGLKRCLRQNLPDQLSCCEKRDTADRHQHGATPQAKHGPEASSDTRASTREIAMKWRNVKQREAPKRSRHALDRAIAPESESSAGMRRP